MLIHNFLENSAARYPDKVAVIHGDERVIYRDLNTRADILAAHLQANGIAKGDRIALLLENSVGYVIAYYATLKAGAVAAPLNPGLKPDGLQSLLTNLEPASIITNFKCERLLKAVDLAVLDLKLLIIQSPKQSWPGTPYAVVKLEDCLNPTKQPEVVGGRAWVDNDKRPTTHHPRPLTNATNPINTSDLASIIYTSGSSGLPKGVMLSHANIVTNTASICQYLEISPNDIQMVVLPFFYVMGKSLLNTHIAAGGTVVLNNRFMYPADVVNQMIEERVTSFSGVPSTYAYLLNRSPFASCKSKLSALRYCSQAGGHMVTALKRALRRSLPLHTRIFIMYGATEASARLTFLPPEAFQAKIKSIGRPIPGVTVRILDENGREVLCGQAGELVAAGANIMQGYWRDPEATAKALDEDGYHTGDIGWQDEDGFFFLKGRKDNQLKVAGHRIDPFEIEDALFATELVVDAAVVGVADDLLGQKLFALVVPLNSDIEPHAIAEKCSARLPGYKMPRLIKLVKALPQNGHGKIDRFECAKVLATDQGRNYSIEK